MTEEPNSLLMSPATEPMLGERDDSCQEAACIDELVARAAALGFSRGELERLAEVYGLEFAKDAVSRRSR